MTNLAPQTTVFDLHAAESVLGVLISVTRRVRVL